MEGLDKNILDIQNYIQQEIKEGIRKGLKKEGAEKYKSALLEVYQDLKDNVESQLQEAEELEQEGYTGISRITKEYKVLGINESLDILKEAMNRHEIEIENEKL